MSNENRLVRLHLVAPFHIDPVPDKSVLGRFEKALRSVGATGSISVRARMITAVAPTKFKTISGLPVSLVGLHGKDDLLVLGPTWALERLSRGESPEPLKAVGRKDWLWTAQNMVQTELDCLSHLPGLLRRAKSVQPSAEITDV